MLTTKRYYNKNAGKQELDILKITHCQNAKQQNRIKVLEKTYKTCKQKINPVLKNYASLLVRKIVKCSAGEINCLSKFLCLQQF